MSDRCSRIFPATAAAILLASLGAPAVVAADSRTDCRTGSPEVRIAACTQILQSNPADFNALANRGVGFRMTGEYDRAVADFNQAMRLDPKNVAVLFLERGLAYEGSSDSQMAITDLSEALRRDSSLVQAYFGRAIAYEAVGQHDLSTTDLREATRRDGNLVAALFVQRGEALRTSHRFEGAISAFDRAIALNPNFPLAYFGRGAAHDERGDIEQAAADYRMFLDFKATADIILQKQQLTRERLEALSQR